MRKRDSRKSLIWRTGALIAIVAAAVGFMRREAILRAIDARMPLAALEKRVKDNPGDTRGVEVLSARLLAARQPARALNILRAATEHGEVPANLWVRRGEAALLTGDGQDAERSAQAALRLSPRMARAHWVLAEACNMQERREDAQAEYRKTTDLDPTHATAWTKMGQYSLHHGINSAAVEQFQHALAASPRSSMAAVGLAQAFFSMGRLPEAERAARDAVDWQPNFAEPHLWLARILAARVENPDPDAAEAEFKEAIRLSPTSPAGYHFLGAFYLQRGDAAQAAEPLQQAIRLVPLLKSNYPLPIKCLRQLGRTAEADELQRKYQVLDAEDADFKRLETLVAQAPRDTGLRLKLAEVYLKHGRVEWARQEADKLKRLAPDSQELKTLMAELSAPSTPAHAKPRGTAGNAGD